MITEMLLLGLAGEAIWECTKELLKQTGAGLIEKVGHVLQVRTRDGTLPPNHDLKRALWRSLGRAARVLAHTIHKPDKAPLSKLTGELKVGSFVERLAEMVQGNILATEPHEHWLSALIDESKKPEAFKDFSLELVGAGSELPSLLHQELNDCMRGQIQHEFIAWTGRHMADNPNRPACFDDYALNGWQIPGGSGHKITFYEVFCLFFREELKHNEVVFRVFTVNTLAELQTDITKALASAPTPQERTRWEQAINKLEDFTSFVTLLESQNATVLDSLTGLRYKGGPVVWVDRKQ